VLKLSSKSPSAKGDIKIVYLWGMNRNLKAIEVPNSKIKKQNP
jgi:hypothetical protein